MSDELKSKVEEWLRTLGCTPVEQDDPEATWHFKIDYPARSPHEMHVVGPKSSPRAVVIASGKQMSHDHAEAFEQLDEDGKDTFLWEFRRALNQMDTDFTMEGVKGALDCPKMFQVSIARYDDGLNLDSFARSVGKVFKTQLSALWVIQQYLGQKGYGSGGGRFDFKKLRL